MFIKSNLINFSRKFHFCYLKTISSNRNLRNVRFYIPGIRARPFKESKYLQKDRIPNEFRIIYKAPMEYYLIASKNVSTITLCLVGAVIFYQYVKGTNLVNIPISDNGLGGLVMGGSDLIYFSIGFLFITIIVRVIVAKYPLRIYKNRDSYIAIFDGQIPFKNDRLYFEKGDVSEHVSSNLNPWRDAMYKIKDRKVLLFIDHFKTPSELTEMLKKEE